MDAWIKVDDQVVASRLYHLLAFGWDLSPAMAEIAAIGEASTRMRFRTETGPDGVRWKPSLRVQLTGGRTLTKDGHLSGSINGAHGRDFAEWGVNRVYAATHQFGAVITARNGGKLRFRLANGAFVSVPSVTIPARPYLGVSPDDRDDILDVLARRIDRYNTDIQGELDARGS